jgi:putative AlgH/UPF0301 family transcriptional regulator
LASTLDRISTWSRLAMPAGQLEGELAKRAWITAPEDPGLVFGSVAKLVLRSGLLW